MAHKPAPRRMAFAPRAMGVLVLAVIVTAFVAGFAGGEIGLVLAGAVFLTIWVYCLLMTLLLALVHGRRALRAGIQVSPGKVETGSGRGVLLGGGNLGPADANLPVARDTGSLPPDSCHKGRQANSARL
ncbi:MAG: hypothetical protein FWB79_06580 [Treponema sp.]|nr:hypothetical protein [Treponema sp.]